MPTTKRQEEGGLQEPAPRELPRKSWCAYLEETVNDDYGAFRITKPMEIAGSLNNEHHANFANLRIVFGN